jgi:hypothetical protein
VNKLDNFKKIRYRIELVNAFSNCVLSSWG